MNILKFPILIPISPGTVKKIPPLGFLAVDHSDFIFQAFPGVPMDSF